ncbi:hypothetical protein DET49_13823 [Salegentibacter sp. 24]|uniref:hypothetical protein n=1 Tax=Salegentibacter sp. 24 TaxID=2183986 RepID=UPI00106221B9|nr:hypothetical protein [Salegentibacter sp. 24]TDN79360.1 hypothetical protein DET49_13823 [Salegentibacter sp. 24]
MKLPFEEWTIEKRFSRNVSKLFNEAFICYKGAAYRASLLFSYLGFLTIIKEIIIKSNKATSIPQGRWDDIWKEYSMKMRTRKMNFMPLQMIRDLRFPMT